MPERIMQLSELCGRLTAALTETPPKGLTREALIDYIRSSTRLLKELTWDVNAIFTRDIKPMLNQPVGLPDEDEAAFFALAQKLSSFTVRIDTGMALSIYQALLARAQHHGDRDKILKYLYWCGITLYYGNKNREEEILSYFSQGAAFRPRYAEFSTAESRQYIHRCMGNQIMLLFSMKRYCEAQKALTKTLAFFNRLLLHDIDGDFPWASFFLSCMNHSRQFFTKKLHSQPQSLAREEIQSIFRISLMMSSLARKLYGENGAGTARYDLALWEAQLVAGQISLANLRENVIAAQELFLPGDYSNEGLHTRIIIPCYIMFYAQKLFPDDPASAEIVREQLDNVTDYMKSLPADINPGAISSYISLFLKNTAGLMPVREHFDWVVKLTTYRHKPTFAHAITVSKLTRRIAADYIKAYPDHFIGIIGIESAAQAAEKTGELLDLAENCGLCHDVGKVVFLQNQTMYARTLSPDELAFVQEHVTEGLVYFDEDEKPEWLMACLHVIEGHHVYYNEQGGYPADFPLSQSPFRPLIHIVTAADSLNSGTDDIGKVYADPKPLAAVLDELDSQSGTRYSPFVTALLKNEGLVADIRDILDNIRQDAYYAAYKFAGGEQIPG